MVFNIKCCCLSVVLKNFQKKVMAKCWSQHSRIRCTQHLWVTKNAIPPFVHYYSISAGSPQSSGPVTPDHDSEKKRGRDTSRQTVELGAMSRRLEDLTEQTIEESGARSRKAFEEAGFSEELKRQLEERIEMSKFKSENAAALAQVNMPVPCRCSIRF